MLVRLRQLAHHLNASRARNSSLAVSPAARSMSSGTVHNDNAACCSIPPVASDYTPKGVFRDYAGVRSYVTGTKGAHAFVCVYDIFGFKPQTQQGADLLAAALGAEVYMPDFFAPAPPWPADQFPPTTDEQKAKLQEFFGGPAAPPKSAEALRRIAEQLKKDGAAKVGAFGFCWGGKVTILAGAGETPLDAVASVHPAMLSAGDAEPLSVPLGLYPSKDEPEDEYKKILGVVAGKPFAAKNDTKHYTNMFHGFAAARADLSNAENKAAFEDVYNRLANFFKNAL